MRRFDRKTFFAYARRAPFGNRLTAEQVAGMSDMLDEWEANHVAHPLTFLAYILAGVFHETGGRMVPVLETFAKMRKEAAANLDRAWRAGRLPTVKTPYWREGYVGGGRIQNTHRSNYAKLERRFKLPFLAKPDLILDSKVDARVTNVGHIEGIWTGRKLADYFGATEDPVGARRIVNGTDKAKLIAGYYQAFKGALEAADLKTPLPRDVPADADQPDVVPAEQSKGLWGWLAGVGGAGGLGALSAINNPFALAAFVAVLLLAGLAAFAVLSGRLDLKRLRRV